MFTFRSILAAALLCVAAAAQDDLQAKPSFVTKPALYPLETCIVSGEPLDADSPTFVVEGRYFRTCCTKCKDKIEASPADWIAKVDKAAAERQRAHYPLEVCVVSGKPLGSMGEPVSLMLDGTLVQLCCKGCVKKAEAKPEAMAGKVRAAAYAAQAKSYPLQTCVVSGEPLDDTAVEAMFGTTLVRLCCKKCLGKMSQDPTPFVAKLHAAWMKAQDHGEGHGKDHGKDHGKGHDKEHGKGHGEHGGKQGSGKQDG